MGDRLVLWSGGGRYVAGKDVAAAAIVSSGSNEGDIIVDWGGGDIELLTGETWDVTVQTWRVFSFTNSCRGSCRTYHTVAYPLNEGYSWSFGSLVTSECGGVRSFPSVSDGAKTFPLKAPITSFGSGSSGCSSAANQSKQIPRIKYPGFGFELNGVPTPTEIEQFTSYAVTTDTSDKSERDTNSPPAVSLLSGNCAIAITFADNTTLDVPLDYYPDWVTVTGENECPPDTCHECEHDGEKCCYALATDGSLELIDRFALTS